MKNFKVYFVVIQVLFAVLWVSCSKDDTLAPLENNSTPPQPVSNVNVENLPGKVKLTYTLPNDKDLLYVVAEYTLENGQKMEVKSSYYKNSMVLEGFTGLEQEEVNIYSVNRSEVKSEPVNIEIAPLKAPIFDIFDSLTVDPDFGGVRVKAQNEEREDIAILVMLKNDKGEFEPLPNSIYTSVSEISESVRGLDTTEKEFAVTVRDRWQNTTDTLFKTISPLYETAIPKSGYAALRLANDQPGYPGTRVENLWDGNIRNWPQVWLTLRSDSSENHTVTFDIGETVKLSRIVIWDYPELIGGVLTYYYLGDMKKFRIWGRADTPDPSGSFDGWTLLGEYEKTKPSGLPYGQQNNEDVEKAEAGFNYEFSLDAPPMRYIRIQNLENYAGLESLAISEVQVYGDPNYEVNNQ